MNRGSSMQGASMQNELTDPVTLTFEPRNSTSSRVSQGHSLHQVWTLWDHSFLSYAPDEQTDSNILPTPTDRVGVGRAGFTGRSMGPWPGLMGAMAPWTFPQTNKNPALPHQNLISPVRWSFMWWIINDDPSSMLAPGPHHQNPALGVGDNNTQDMMLSSW